METVEHFAKIALVAHQLGSVRSLDPQQVSDLVALRQRFNISDRPSCELEVAGETAAEDGKPADRDALVERIIQHVLRELGQRT
jgi:hypothetical protein